MTEEYIRRDALQKELQEELDFESPMYTADQNKHINIGLKIALRAIKKLPAADVEEVKHERWMWEGLFKACSRCGSYVDWNDTLGANRWKYCPYCGAKMDKENENHG